MTYKEKIKHRESIQKNKTRAGRVRAAARILSTFRIADILDMCHRDPEKAVRNAFRDLIRKSGEIEALGGGMYAFRPKEKRRTYLDVMWHLVRSHRHFTTDDIERLSGARRSTVLEYLNYLKSVGILEKAGWKAWRLVKDPGPTTPSNTQKIAKLARIRAAKKKAHATSKEKRPSVL